MRARESLKIGYRKFTLRFIRKIDDGGYLGCTDKQMGRIRVEKGLPPDEKANTVLHEILHGIWHTQALDYSAVTEERIVTALANGLTGFVRDNPRFILRLLRLAWKK